MWLQGEIDRLVVIDPKQQGSHVSGLAPIGLGEPAAPRPTSPHLLLRPGARRWDLPSTCTFGEKAALRYFTFWPDAGDGGGSMLWTQVGRASSHHCTPAYWHVLIILQYALPLKVIPLEHNHAQSKAQTSYIKETVNSRRVHSTPVQKCFSLDFSGWTWAKLK